MWDTCGRCRALSHSDSEPLRIGSCQPGRIFALQEIRVVKDPSTHSVMPNSGRGYNQNPTGTPQTSHRRRFGNHLCSCACRLQRPGRDTHDGSHHLDVRRHRSGDQSQLTDVSSHNNHGESGRRHHLAQRRSDHTHRYLRTLRRSGQDDRPAVLNRTRRHVQRKARRKRQNIQLYVHQTRHLHLLLRYSPGHERHYQGRR